MPFDVAPSRIDATEARLGVRLPAAYRDSMTRNNGGAVTVDDETWWLHPIFDDSDLRRLQRSTNDLVHETTEARAWRAFPPTAIAIAHDGRGDYLVFRPLDDDASRLGEAVLRWDHETAELLRVADRFDALPWSSG